MRGELDDGERAIHTDRLKRLYEAEHPETKHGGDQKSSNAKSSRQNGDSIPDRFTKTTAASTGRSERSIQRDSRRGKELKEELPDIIGTMLACLLHKRTDILAIGGT